MTVTLPPMPDFEESDEMVEDGLTKLLLLPEEDEVEGAGDETVFEPVSMVVTFGPLTETLQRCTTSRRRRSLRS